MSDDKIKRDSRSRLREEVQTKLEAVEVARNELREDVGRRKTDRRLEELTAQFVNAFTSDKVRFGEWLRELEDNPQDFVAITDSRYPQVSLLPAFEKMRDLLEKHTPGYVETLRAELRLAAEKLMVVHDELGKLEFVTKASPRWYQFWRK